MEKRTSLFENGLIWFGAGVSIAEIVTGTYLAPLGFGKGVAAILLGHLIGCVLLYLAGHMGGVLRRSAMETAKLSFGQKGALLFAVLNILQLVGWTGIMIYDGALAADTIFGVGRWVWCLVIGALIILWILIGIQNLGKVNTVSMAALFLLTIVEFHVEGSRKCHDELLALLVSMTATVDSSRHIVDPINTPYLEWHMSELFDDGEVAPDI